MSHDFLAIATTPSVQATQAAMNAAPVGRHAGRDRPSTRFTAAEAAFVAERDSFYLATVSETGWPYIQHRGGPKGFLHLIDDRTLAFADLRGNRQYISTGNLAGVDRACLFLMDYPRRARLKMFVRVDVLALDADPALTARLVAADTRAKAERIIRLHLQAFDWNCPQHITPRFTEGEIAEAVAPLGDRLRALEHENAALRSRLASVPADLPL